MYAVPTPHILAALPNCSLVKECVAPEGDTTPTAQGVTPSVEPGRIVSPRGMSSHRVKSFSSAFHPHNLHDHPMPPTTTQTPPGAPHHRREPARILANPARSMRPRPGATPTVAAQIADGAHPTPPPRIAPAAARSVAPLVRTSSTSTTNRPRSADPAPRRKRIVPATFRARALIETDRWLGLCLRLSAITIGAPNSLATPRPIAAV